MKSPRYLDRLYWACLAITWVWFAGGALWAHFSTDDTNNLFTYWTLGWGGLVKANVLFFSPVVRPMGGVLYHALYSLFGLAILPYRVVCLALIVINAALVYFATREITREHWLAAAVTALASVHPSLWLIYYSNGTLFDVLCYGFVMATVLAYARGWHAAWVVVLFAAALNSKEMAVTLPVALAVLPRPRWRVMAGLGAMSVAFAMGKAMSPLATAAAYHPVYSVARFMETSRSLLGHVFLTQFSDAAVVLLYAAMAVHVLVTRSRLRAFAFVMAVAGFAPLNFITPREPFVVYLPLCGWALYVVSAVRLHPRVIAVVALVAVMVLMVTMKGRQQDVIGSQAPLWRLVESMRAVPLRPEPASCVLLTGDPFYPDWDTYFLAKLHYGDRSVRVDVMSPKGDARGDECATHEYRVVVEEGRARLP